MMFFPFRPWLAFVYVLFIAGSVAALPVTSDSDHRSFIQLLSARDTHDGDTNNGFPIIYIISIGGITSVIGEWIIIIRSCCRRLRPKAKDMGMKNPIPVAEPRVIGAPPTVAAPPPTVARN
ncbi:hypothetical protein B0H19DRAFT_1271897 [Mycena capillaripes]|nr:hypothetical protein B0H19DRAFT_1271897 [Mycena capillaripes]